MLAWRVAMSVTGRPERHDEPPCVECSLVTGAYNAVDNSHYGGGRQKNLSVQLFFF